MTAADTSIDLDCILSVGEVAVLRALELAGRRGLTRSLRGAARDTPAHLLHTRFAIAPDLTGAWDHLTMVYPGQPKLVTALDWYVRELIKHRRPHSRAELARVLAVVYEVQ